MELVTQPPGSYKCGQACVAMVAGVSLKQSIKAFGLEHATNLYSVRNALKKLGFEAAEKCVAFGMKESKLPETCMLMLTYHKNYGGLGHWVVYHKEQVYDPAGSIYPFDMLLLFAQSVKYLVINPK